VKVTGYEVFPVVCPPPFRGGRSWLFVRLDTDSGPHGYGEMMMLGMGFRLPVLATMVADILEAKKIASIAKRRTAARSSSPRAVQLIS
jgi:2-dehydro-3-deoxyphosphogalactonate aldolase